MKAEKLHPNDLEAFKAYCTKHRSKIDDSFLYDEDLASFEPDDENPTCVIWENGTITAAASLIIDDYHKRGRSGRFRIFYCEKQEIDMYALLLSEIISGRDDLQKVFLFVPFVNTVLAESMARLGFIVERYVFFLVREIGMTPQIELPGGYAIRSFQPGRDEENWCRIRNTAFSNLKGNSTPVTPEMALKMVSEPDYLEGGMLLLLHDNKPVGLIRGADDDYEGTPAMNIGPVAVLPEYQGKGLGRQLLHAALAFAAEKGYNKTTLCVNAENEKAKELYLKEGFVQTEGVAEYAYFLNKP